MVSLSFLVILKLFRLIFIYRRRHPCILFKPRTVPRASLDAFWGGAVAPEAKAPEGWNRSAFRSKRPPGGIQYYLSAPGPPSGAPGGHLGPTWRPEAPWRPPGLIFCRPTLLLHVLLMFYGFRLDVYAFPLPVDVRFRLRARLRSLCSLGFESFISKVGSPGSLSPWVAAGCREAIGV